MSDTCGSGSDRFRALVAGRTAPALISVHRGLWGPAPENGHAAVTGAAALGIVEIDVQLAADGVPVVHHDETLQRMAGDPRSIAATPSDALTQVPLREGIGGPGAAMTGECLPTLADLLARAADDAFFDFDAKNPGEVYAIADWIAAHGHAARGSVKVDTATDADIVALRRLRERTGMMVMAKVMLNRTGPDHIRALRDAGVAAAEVWFDDLSQLEAAVAAGGDELAISTYTLDPVHCCGLSDTRALTDPEAVWGRLIDAGVRVLMTDRALALHDFMALMGARRSPGPSAASG